MVSATTRDKRRLVKRGPTFRPVNDHDLRWLWAAYKMGVWNDILVEGMGREEFAEAVTDIIATFDYDWILEVRTDMGLRPVGLVTGDLRFRNCGIEAHVNWFPWASSRNILESAAHFLMEVGKSVKVHLYIREADLPFWTRVWQYKVIKRQGKINDCYGPGEDVMHFYTPGPFQ